MGWLELLEAVPEERRMVVHVPETVRYRRARTKLRYIIEKGKLLGVQRDPERDDVVLLAVWAPPGHGRGDGYYCCFRIFFVEGGPVFAALYCFYDGTERSVGLKSLSAAVAFARHNHFLPELP